MGAPAASRLRVAALLALRPALRPVRFDAHVLGPGCAAFGLAGSALRPTPRRFRAAGPAPAPLEGSLWVAFAAPALSLRSRRRASGERLRGRRRVAGCPAAAAGRRGDARKLLRVAFPLAAPLPRQRYPSPCCGYARIDFVRTKSPGPRRRAALAGQSLSRLPVCRMRYNRMRGRFAAWAAPTV